MRKRLVRSNLNCFMDRARRGARCLLRTGPQDWVESPATPDALENNNNNKPPVTSWPEIYDLSLSAEVDPSQNETILGRSLQLVLGGQCWPGWAMKTEIRLTAEDQ